MSTDDASPQPAAGWYSQSDGSRRYWDGSGWAAADVQSGEAVLTPMGAEPGKRWWRWGFENSWPVWVSLLVRAAVLLFLFAGGGTWLVHQVAPGKISADELQTEITGTLNQRLEGAGSTARVSSLLCEDVTNKKGSVGICQLYMSDGEHTSVKVTVDDNDGHYEWQVMG